MDHSMTEVHTAPRPALASAEPTPRDLLQQACSEMVSNALDFCEQKTRAQGREAVTWALRAGNRAAHEYLRYALAKEIGNYLGHVAASVKTVYHYEPESTPGEIVNGRPARPTRGLDLIVRVDGDDKEALMPIVDELSSEILRAYQELLGPAAQAMQTFLAVDVVDDRDVQQRRGAGALLASIYTRPTKVWSRFVIQLNPEFCGQCHICSSVCPFDAITITPDATAAKIDLDRCQFCGMCYSACPAGAIEAGYYDFMALDRSVQTSMRATGFKAIALTCRGSTPTLDEIEEILGRPGFVPICLPCVGRTPPEFFLKALATGVERIAVMPCKDDHCRFDDGSRMIRNRTLLLQSTLRALNYPPDAIIFREAQGPVATVNADLCTGCGTCIGLCPYGAIQPDRQNGGAMFVAVVDPAACQGCGACAAGCPSRAIAMDRFADDEILLQIEAALAEVSPVTAQNGSPHILGFRCNWCSYGDADLPFDRIHHSSQNVEIIRVPCAGRIDPLHIVWAFVNGADGVFVGGCPPDDCRYVSGSREAQQRMARLSELLQAFGFDPRRLRQQEIRRESPEAFDDGIREFARDVRQLGKVFIQESPTIYSK